MTPESYNRRKKFTTFVTFTIMEPRIVLFYFFQRPVGFELRQEKMQLLMNSFELKIFIWNTNRTSIYLKYLTRLKY